MSLRCVCLASPRSTAMFVLKHPCEACLLVHFWYGECACLSVCVRACAWWQCTGMWVYSCCNDVTCWKLIHSAPRWRQCLLEEKADWFHKGNLNEGFPAVAVNDGWCPVAMGWGWRGWRLRRGWSGDCANSSYQLSYGAQARLWIPPPPLHAQPCCHFSLRHWGSQVTPPPLLSSTHTPPHVRTHACSALAQLTAQTRFSSCQNLKIWLTDSKISDTEENTHAERTAVNILLTPPWL